MIVKFPPSLVHWQENKKAQEKSHKIERTFIKVVFFQCIYLPIHKRVLKKHPPKAKQKTKDETQWWVRMGSV